MVRKTIILATRESQLALWQANWVKQRLEALSPDLDIKLLGMTTQADKMPYISLQEVGGKGLFVKELEEALLTGRADIAVHSLKDMPVNLPTGLGLAAFCERADPRDVLVSNHYKHLEDIPLGSLIGTSSLRRQSQLLHLRPDLEIKPLRGNIKTRLAKLDAGNFAGIILAAAGLERLGFQNRMQAILSTEEFLPAACQGILGIECREEDLEIKNLLQKLNHAKSEFSALAERAVSRQLGGNCQVPVAAFSEIKDDSLWIRGLVGSADGRTILRAERRGKINDAEWLGVEVANDLLSQGAEAFLKSP